jgi:hypothetical protein
MTLLRCTLVLAVLLFERPAWSQDVASGPEKGKDVAALKVYDATGPYKEKDVDYAVERKGKPTIYIFVQADKFDRPMAKFMKGLDQGAPKVHEDVAIVAVWVTGDAAKSKEYLPRAQQSLDFTVTALTCCTEGEAGPKGWTINADAHATIVVANRGKVAMVFGYMSLNDTHVRTVLDALKKATNAK